MGFSSRHAIATHILLVLACCKSERVCSDELAASVNTNAVVIRRLVSRLKEQGLVDVCKGKEGGYSLKKSLESISLWDVFEAVEDPPLFAQHTAPPNPDCSVGNVIGPLLDDVYNETEAAIRNTLQKISMSDLAEEISKIKKK